MVRLDRYCRARYCAVFELRRVLIQIDQGNAVTVQCSAAGGAGKYQRRPCISQHISQPLGRVIRVQRQVGTAGLQHRQDGDDQLERAFQRNTHQHIRPHALPAQVMRQAVGTCIQLAIAELPVFKHQRDLCRGIDGLRFKSLVDARVRQARGLGVVPRHQHTLPRGLIKHGQGGKRPGTVFGQRAQHHLPLLGHSLHLHGVKHSRIVTPAAATAILGNLHQ
ncbi:hypothetical protein IGB42_03975 [Andreprevotia sp. IGB-42]|nr:hypothetical protein IGB42_03975 [Andreprevotia sp. IGB-42]